jgi:hypothetical protein
LRGERGRFGAVGGVGEEGCGLGLGYVRFRGLGEFIEP